jgi:hypothetical protein
MRLVVGPAVEGGQGGRWLAQVKWKLERGVFFFVHGHATLVPDECVGFGGRAR